MGFPIVDTRALGWGFVQSAPPQKKAELGRPVPFMGERASDAVNEAAKSLEKARAYSQRIHDAYQDLAEAIGEDRAKEVWGEAQMGLERAQKAYDTTVEIAGGSR